MLGRPNGNVPRGYRMETDFLRVRRGLFWLFLFVVILVFVLVSETGLTQGDGERVEVFRGLAWGDPLEQVGEGDTVIEKKSEELGIRAYIRRGDRLELGSVPLEELVYEFFEDGLTRIRLKYSHEHFSAIHTMMTERYGFASETNLINSYYIWYDGDTQIYQYWPLSAEDYMSFVEFSSISRVRRLSQWQYEEALFLEATQTEEEKKGAFDW